MLSSAMVESNHDEERFARIAEHAVETLGREAARLLVPAKVVPVVAVAHAPEVPI
jgi:hypothetical protein